MEYVFKTTGKYPAIWGTDLISRNRDNNNFAFVTDAWKRGWPAPQNLIHVV
jgi:hypothetical protein